MLIGTLSSKLGSKIQHDGLGIHIDASRNPAGFSSYEQSGYIIYHVNVFPYFWNGG